MKNELLEIDEVKEIPNKKYKGKFKNQKTNIHKDKNMKKFIEKWKKGLTTFEINEEIGRKFKVKKELKKN